MPPLDQFNETVRHDLARPFTISGRRAYLAGFMNGSFPPMGTSSAGRNGRAVDAADQAGRRLVVWPSGNADTAEWQWLYGDNCRDFTMQPGRANQHFELSMSGSALEARQEFFIPENEPALFLSLTLTNPTAQPRRLKLAWLVRFELRGAWWTDWPDRPDEARYNPRMGSLLARDSLTKSWAAVMRGDQTPIDFKIGPEVWAAERTPSLKGTDDQPEGILRNPAQLQGEGISGRLDYAIELAPQASQTSIS